MQVGSIPSLEAFLAAPLAEVRAVAPATIIYTPGGTRRAAALAGINVQSEEYPAWSLTQMWRVIEVIARAGVQHVVINIAWPGQFAETTPHYRERLFSWIADGIGGDRALAIYEDLALAPRLLHADDEALAPLNRCLDRARRGNAQDMRLWWYVCPDHNLPWRALGRAAAAGVRTQAEMTEFVCGEAVPPASLLVSFGKPLLSPGIMPLFLVERTSSYWTQDPGFSLDDETFRRILYDHHYLRSTWSEDKTGRYEQVDAMRGLPKGHVVGLGRRVGPFWVAGEGDAGDEDAD